MRCKVTADFNGIITLTSLLVTALVACSPSPRQYPQSSQIPQESNLRDNPAFQVLSTPTQPQGGLQMGETKELSEEERAQQIRANNRAPILYGKGGANITSQTTFAEAQKILSSPALGPLSELDGLTFYDKESVRIQWREDEPRRPLRITFYGEYQGSLAAPPPYESLQINGDLSEAFAVSKEEPAPQNPRVRQFIESLYRFHEKTDEACLAAGKCGIQGAPNGSFVLNLPGVQIMVSGGRRQLIKTIVIDFKVSAGRMESPFDLLRGSFVGENGQSFLSLGDSYAHFVATVGPHPESTVDGGQLLKRFRGVRAWFARQGVETEVLADARLQALEFDPEYQQEFFLNGKKLGFGTQWGEKARQGESVYDALVKLAEEIQSQWRSESVLTGFRVEGLKSNKTVQNLVLRLARWDKVKQTGQVIGLKYVVGRNALITKVTRTGDEFDALIQPAQLANVDLSTAGGSLAGFRLGEELEISNVDIGRGDATVRLVSESGPGQPVRTHWSGAIQWPVLLSSPRLQNISFQPASAVDLESSVRLVLQPVKGEVSAEPVKTEIIGIESSMQYGAIKGLCLDVELRFGQSDQEVRAALRKAVYAARENSKIPICEYVAQLDSGASGELESLFFPKHGVRLGFEERELKTIALYRRSEGGSK